MGSEEFKASNHIIIVVWIRLIRIEELEKKNLKEPKHINTVK